MARGNLRIPVDFNTEMPITEWIDRLFEVGRFYGSHRSFKISDALGPEIRNSLPEVVTAPAITGTAQEGQTLTCGTGTWYGSPTYTYQWKRDTVAISGATAATRVLAGADVGAVMTCTVTATNSYGSAASTSAGTAAVIAA